MKKTTLFGLALLLIVSVVFANYNVEMKKYKKYADNRLNYSFKAVCDEIIYVNALLETAIENEYIPKTFLQQYSEFPSWYLSNFYDVEKIAYEFYSFNFSSYRSNQDYKSNHSDFIVNLVDMFAEEDLENASTELRYLTDDELKVLKKSYDYSKEATKIIKDRINYYTTFEYKIVLTDKYTGKDAYFFEKVYLEEHLIPWADNRSGGSGSNSSASNVNKGQETFRYDYPENPMIHITDSNWIDIFKELYKLNVS